MGEWDSAKQIYWHNDNIILYGKANKWDEISGESGTKGFSRSGSKDNQIKVLKDTTLSYHTVVTSYRSEDKEGGRTHKHISAIKFQKFMINCVKNIFTEKCSYRINIRVIEWFFYKINNNSLQCTCVIKVKIK